MDCYTPYYYSHIFFQHICFVIWQLIKLFGAVSGVGGECVAMASNKFGLVPHYVVERRSLSLTGPVVQTFWHWAGTGLALGWQWAGTWLALGWY